MSVGVGDHRRDAIPELGADGVTGFRILGGELADQGRRLFAIQAVKAFGQSHYAIARRQ